MIKFKNLFSKNENFTFEEYNENKFILFSWTRTGASNIALMLDLHKDLNYVAEPFNKGKKIIPESLNGKGIPALKSCLRETIWAKYNFLKHNHGLSESQNKYLLSHPNHKVVFLWRKNALQRIVSQHMAIQSKIWGFNVDKDQKVEQLKNHKFKPLQISVLNGEIKSYLENVSLYLNYLRDNNIPHMEIIYEDLYDTSQGLDKKVDIVQNILQFFNLLKFEDPNIIEDIKWRFDPNNMKQNKSYDMIPNIHEVEKELASEINGSLNL